jgi:hypothetical protein
MKRLRVLASVCVVAVMVVPAPMLDAAVGYRAQAGVSGQLISVALDGSGDYTSIQAAIESASGQNGSEKGHLQGADRMSGRPRPGQRSDRRSDAGCPPGPGG